MNALASLSLPAQPFASYRLPCVFCQALHSSQPISYPFCKSGRVLGARNPHGRSEQTRRRYSNRAATLLPPAGEHIGMHRTVDFQPQRNNLSEQRVSAVSETAGRHRKGPPAHVPAGVGFVAGRRDESEGHAPPTRRALLPGSARRVPRTRFGCPRRVTPPAAPHPYRRGRAPRTPASGRARRARATPRRTRP